MKLRNKKTGEIANLTLSSNGEELLIMKNNEMVTRNVKLSDLEEWEDAPEEPKEYWYIAHNGIVGCFEYDDDWQYMDFNWQDKLKQIGNYFETKEEAEKAVEKLKAWKRLKDKGFRFTLTPGVGSLDITPGKFQIEITADMPAKWFCCDAVQKDLEVCFGGEE